MILADPFPSLCRQEEKESSSDNQPLHPGDILAVEASAQKPLPTYKKSLRLSSEQIVCIYFSIFTVHVCRGETILKQGFFYS